ncbi:hypothetical protein F4604DRAFT_1925655 [Suillus subluteus]|nr:hypothetical protein F4604DRAFT_1925655 [Suillus subluteus]
MTALQEVLNTKKAEASCAPDYLVQANALDKCSHETLDLEEHQQLLRMDFSSIKVSCSLPRVIPLYVRMLVILRVCNISTDLGITNGSQGVIRYISTVVCPVGLMYVRCVIVKFPGSKVQLRDLPSSCFPVVPVSWTFTTLLKGVDELERKLRITCLQLPIQPAFAVMGHSAQGKTLASVLVNLHEGGFRAYVAASHAQSHASLCITQTVSLDQLNKPLPADLLHEVRHFEAIEINTYVWHGLHAGNLVSVPDAESDMAITPVSYTANFMQDPAVSTKR